MAIFDKTETFQQYVSSSSTRDATLFTKTGEYEYIFMTIHIRNKQVQHEQPCQ